MPRAAGSVRQASDGRLLTGTDLRLIEAKLDAGDKVT